MRHHILLGIFLWALPALAACGSHGAPPDDAALPDRPVPPDRRVLPERIVLPDAMPDIPDSWDATRPQGVHYDFCDQPIWQIPQQDSVTRDVHFDMLSGTDLFYHVDISGRQAHTDLYYFDLATCTEYSLRQIAPDGLELTNCLGTGERRAVLVGWDDTNNFKTGLLLNLDRWQLRALFTDQPGSFVFNAQSNGSVLASFFTAVRNQGPFDLQLLDLETNDATDVWSGPLAFSYMAVTDSFVLFEREVTDPACTSLAITHFVDLEDLSQGDIQDTCVKSQHEFMGSGRRIGYVEAQGLLPAPYTCVVMDMDTNQKWVLTQDDQAYCIGGMGGHLVFWKTARYGTNGETYDNIGDIMVTDLDANTERRLTSQAVYLNIMPQVPIPRAAAYVRDSQGAHIYVLNLEALNIIDPDGHLIEGPPIDEITQLGLQ